MSYAIVAYLVGTAGLLALIVFLSGWAPAFSVNHAVFLAGWGFAFAGIFYDSYLEFVGLKQAWCHVRRLPFEVSRFKTGFVFRLCRRPSFFGILVGCWATPMLTAGHAFFAATMTAFTLAGCYFVERTYLGLYGNAYREFQSTTPLLLPRLSVLWDRGRMSRGLVR